MPENPPSQTGQQLSEIDLVGEGLISWANKEFPSSTPGYKRFPLKARLRLPSGEFCTQVVVVCYTHLFDDVLSKAMEIHFVDGECIPSALCHYECALNIDTINPNGGRTMDKPRNEIVLTAEGRSSVALDSKLISEHVTYLSDPTRTLRIDYLASVGRIQSLVTKFAKTPGICIDADDPVINPEVIRSEAYRGRGRG